MLDLIYWNLNNRNLSLATTKTASSPHIFAWVHNLIITNAILGKDTRVGIVRAEVPLFCRPARFSISKARTTSVTLSTDIKTAVENYGRCHCLLHHILPCTLNLLRMQWLWIVWWLVPNLIGQGVSSPAPSQNVEHPNSLVFQSYFWILGYRKYFANSLYESNSKSEGE